MIDEKTIIEAFDTLDSLFDELVIKEKEFNEVKDTQSKVPSGSTPFIDCQMKMDILEPELNQLTQNYVRAGRNVDRMRTIIMNRLLQRGVTE